MPDPDFKSQDPAGGSCDPGKEPPPSKLRERLDEFERVLRQAATDAEQAVRSGIKSALPSEAHKHLSNSKKEFLLFVRNIVDNEIQRSERHEDEKQSPQDPSKDK